MATLDSDFDVASVTFFHSRLLYGKHYFFIFSLSFDHFAHFLKYPNHKTIINQHIQYLFARFAFIPSKHIILSFGPIILPTVHLAARRVLLSARVAGIIME